MADWRDVMAARAKADELRTTLDHFGEMIEQEDGSRTALAVALAGLAITAELRALGTTINYAMADLASAAGRGL